MWCKNIQVVDVLERRVGRFIIVSVEGRKKIIGQSLTHQGIRDERRQRWKMSVV